MPDSSDNHLDRYLADRLSPAEQRELAQAALDDPDLFDMLTAAAVVKAALVRDDDSVSVPAVDPQPGPAGPAPFEPVTLAPRSPGRSVSFHRVRNARVALTWAAMATAAAAVVAVLLIQRASPPASGPPAGASSASSPAPAGTAAGAGAARALPPPVILSARLDQQSGRSAAEFRSTGADGRLPRGEGVVVSIEDGQVNVDLGAVDGLERGTVVRLFRGANSATAAGTVTIGRVFRDRATGLATPAGSLQVGDRVELAPAIQMAALMDHVEARIASGDTGAARTLAERAVSISPSRGVPADLTRRARARLGTLEHRAGDLDAAERHLRSAADDLAAVPAATDEERAEVLNELGAVLIELGNHAEADAILRRAQQDGATGAAGVRVTNNLAALAALRGDLVTAATMYRAALTMAGSARDLESDRQAIEKNLEALRAPR